MTPAMWGALLGGTAALGMLLVLARVTTIRRPQLALRVLPYVRDVPHAGHTARLRDPSVRTSALTAVFGPILRSGADLIDRALGGSASVARRLERANLPMTVHEFRIEQVLWGLVGFGLCAAVSLLRSVSGGGSAIASLLLCLVGFGVGVIARDNRLSGQAKKREAQVIAEFPTVAELLALAVAAGESPVAALARVAARSGGELSVDLGRVLADIRTGTPVAEAFDRLAARTGLAVVARFATGIAVAVDRGTPLADVLHAQAGDVRDFGRRELIESAARKEVAMMVPVVFLVLPVTVLFAFFPGAIGLRVIVP